MRREKVQHTRGRSRGVLVGVAVVAILALTIVFPAAAESSQMIITSLSHGGLVAALVSGIPISWQVEARSLTQRVRCLSPMPRWGWLGSSRQWGPP
jgi:hypothetical protein